jgi:hypothetical protein
VEERFLAHGPSWLRSAEVLRVVDNYVRSGLRFVYVHTPLLWVTDLSPGLLKTSSPGCTS